MAGPGGVEQLRRELAVRVVGVLGLPGSVAGDQPRLDKYLLQADPECLRGVVELIAGQLPPDAEVLAGMELGGVPLAAAVALRTGLPWAVLRRGGQGLAGTPVDGRRTVVVKDMTRTGAAVTAAAGLLRANGAVVTHAAVGLNWNPGLAELLEPVGVRPVAALGLAELRQAWQARSGR